MTRLHLKIRSYPWAEPRTLASPPLVKYRFSVGRSIIHKSFSLQKFSIMIFCFSLMTDLRSKSSLTVVLVGKLAQRRFLIVVQESWLPLMIIPRVIFLILLRVSLGNIYCKNNKKFNLCFMGKYKGFKSMT